MSRRSPKFGLARGGQEFDLELREIDTRLAGVCTVVGEARAKFGALAFADDRGRGLAVGTDDQGFAERPPLGNAQLLKLFVQVRVHAAQISRTTLGREWPEEIARPVVWVHAAARFRARFDETAEGSSDVMRWYSSNRNATRSASVLKPLRP